ncbi:MAG: HK97 gp10 family phage protein [Thiohalomonadales bacterium]
MIKADVKGIKELERTLKKMTGREANNAVAAGLRAGGRVIVKDARSRLPSEYDILKKSLTVKIKRRTSPYVLD